MKENEVRTGSALPGAAELDETSVAVELDETPAAEKAADAPSLDHDTEKLAKDCDSAKREEQPKPSERAGSSDAYRERLSALAAQNAEDLTAFANYAAEKVPSAARLVQGIVAAYSLSSSARIAKVR
jgi:hypothetical protein